MLRPRRPLAVGTSGVPVRLRGLRLRLTLLFTCASAIGLIVLSLLVLAADSRYEHDRVDSSLRDRARQARDALVISSATSSVLPSAGTARGLGVGHPWLYVFAVGGRDAPAPNVLRAVLTPSSNDAPPARALTVAQTALTSRHELRTDLSSPGHQLRLLATPFFDDRGDTRGVVVAVTDSSLSSDHNRLTLEVWTGCGVLLVTSAAVGYALARRSTLPVGEAVAQQERFLADAAHELRGPVTALRAVSDGGLTGDEEPYRALQRVRGIVDDASETLDNLLTLARMDARSQAVTIEPVRLDLLVEALLSDRCDEPPIELVATETVVNSDAQLLRRAIGNLIDNAVQHGRSENPDAEIRVTVQTRKVRIEDHGPGLEPDLLPQLFERFRSGRRSRGSGLGLGIVDWVARAHHGKVTAANRPGGGAIFTLTLPR